jgi:drug/metabolite transporter (DMT)-like permease
MNYLERLAPILFLLMWSSGAIFVKMGLENASVWSFLTLRATGAFLLMGVIREFNFEVRHSPMPPDGTLRIP